MHVFFFFSPGEQQAGWMFIDSEGFRHELWWHWRWWASWDSNEVNLKSPFLIFLLSQVCIKPVALTYGCTLESPCCLIAKSCLTLCDPMDCSRPGSPVLHYLLEFARPLSRWCHLTSSPFAALFSFCPQSFPASGSFLMSQLVEQKYP